MLCGAHGELVHQQALIRGLEQLDREHTGDAELLGDRGSDARGHLGDAAGRARCRCEHLRAHPVALHRLDHRPEGDVTRGPAGHELRELAAELHLLFGEQRTATTVFVEGEEPLLHLVGRGHHTHTLAVVPATCGLDHGFAAVVRDERIELGRCGDAGPVGHRDPEFAEALPHAELVLGELQRLRARMHGHAVLHERPQYGLGHVLVVEGDDVDVAG